MTFRSNRHLSKTIKYSKQGGYTTVFIIFLFAAIALSIFSLYDVGQVTSHKQKMQNTADAVAYSTVNIITRDMNLIAYTNRAMVANQVAIGQLVALSSWTHMADISADNMDKVVSYIQRIPYIGQTLGTVLKIMTTIMKYATDILQNIADGVAKAGIPIQEGIIVVLSGLQNTYHQFAKVRAIDVYNDIARQNDPHLDSGVAFNGVAIVSVLRSFHDEVDGYNPSDTRRYGSKGRNAKKRFNEFAQMVKDSRDNFMPKRTYKYWRLPGWIRRIAGLDIWFDRGGGTDYYMKKDRRGTHRWHWTSMDTHSFWWGYRRLTWRGFRWRYRELIPLGWGAGHALHRDLRTRNGEFRYDRERRADTRQNYWFRNGQYHRRATFRRHDAWGNAWRNRKAGRLLFVRNSFSGNNRIEARNNLSRSMGLQKFHDFKEDTKKDIGPDLVVFLTKNVRNIRTQQSLDQNIANYDRSPDYQIESEGGIPGDAIYGLSKAETYFSRPEENVRTSKRWKIQWGRDDRLREYGNLYNPFWQTRLKETTEKEEGIALATLGFRP